MKSKNFNRWTKLLAKGCEEMQEPPYELPKCRLIDNACRYDTCPKMEVQFPQKQKNCAMYETIVKPVINAEKRLEKINWQIINDLIANKPISVLGTPEIELRYLIERANNAKLQALWEVNNL
jgi:hypothetical protein